MRKKVFKIILFLFLGCKIYAIDNYPTFGEFLYVDIFMKYHSTASCLFLKKTDQENFLCKQGNEIKFVALDNTTKILYVYASYKSIPTNVSILKSIKEGNLLSLYIRTQMRDEIILSPANVAYKYPMIDYPCQMDNSIRVEILYMINLNAKDYNTIKDIIRKNYFLIFTVEIDSIKALNMLPVYEFISSEKDKKKTFEFFEECKKNYKKYASEYLEIWDSIKNKDNLEEAYLKWINAAAKKYEAVRE